jgi:hypothetical protein
MQLNDDLVIDATNIMIHEAIDQIRMDGFGGSTRYHI